MNFAPDPWSFVIVLATLLCGVTLACWVACFAWEQQRATQAITMTQTPISIDDIMNAARIFALLAAERYVLAKRLALAALAERPDDPLLWQGLGLACWHLEDWPAAELALERATALGVLRGEAQLALADCYRRRRRYALAHCIYSWLAKARHTPTELLPPVAAGLGHLGDFRAALRACHRLTKAAPERHSAYFGMAYYLHQLQYPPRTRLAALRRAFALAPQCLSYRINYGFTLAQVGLLDAALAVLESVPIAELRLPCWLHQLRGWFTLAGRTDLANACSEQLRRLVEETAIGGIDRPE